MNTQEVMPDHAHLFITAHPKFAPSTIVKNVRCYHQGSPGYRPGTSSPFRCRRRRIASRARRLALYQRGILPRGGGACRDEPGEWEKQPGIRGISRH
ncbi:MAG: hypothetical protein GX882_06305 [Methanomicrobiales archaeon]|nr:hypothetical protein [Methanomicrobiales archaeon]